MAAPVTSLMALLRQSGGNFAPYARQWLCRVLHLVAVSMATPCLVGWLCHITLVATSRLLEWLRRMLRLVTAPRPV